MTKADIQSRIDYLESEIRARAIDGGGTAGPGDFKQLEICRLALANLETQEWHARWAAFNGELSPCPFCGGRASIIAVSEPSNVGGYVVQCEGCEASTRVWFPVKDDVRVLLTQAWNRRASARLTPAESENDPTDALIVHRLRAWCARWIAVKDKTDPWYHAAEELSRTMFQPIGAGSPARQESQMSNGPFDPAIPRRIDLRRNTPAELSIRAAIHEVEKVGAEVRLTDAVTLLGAALHAVADFTDATQPIIRRLWYPKEELLPEAQVSQGHADSARQTGEPPRFTVEQVTQVLESIDATGMEANEFNRDIVIDMLCELKRLFRAAQAGETR